jgi:thiamine-phosphate pyrophosphorylase
VNPHLLYYITDRHGLADRALKPFLYKAINAGVDVIQIREKDLETRELLALAQECSVEARAVRTRILVNDRLDVALAAGAHGIHLGGRSLPVARVRSISTQGFLVGVSCHSVRDVLEAEPAGADYALLGPIFDTPSKRGYGSPLGLRVVEEAASKAKIPVYALGGITVDTSRSCFEAGAQGVAAIRMFQDAPSLAGRVRELRAL